METVPYHGRTVINEVGFAEKLDTASEAVIKFHVR